ncbi:MAG: hypothetical protein QME79_14135, partial [Bacillota bacterium]|nr:hypothetical protein [Bacillota bacterium]
LRRKGPLHRVLIASGPRGFYVPQNEEESLRCLQTLQSREDEAAETRAAYEKLHKELYGRRAS